MYLESSVHIMEQMTLGNSVISVSIIGKMIIIMDKQMQKSSCIAGWVWQA